MPSTFGAGACSMSTTADPLEKLRWQALAGSLCVALTRRAGLAEFYGASDVLAACAQIGATERQLPAAVAMFAKGEEADRACAALGAAETAAALRRSLCVLLFADPTLATIERWNCFRWAERGEFKPGWRYGGQEGYGEAASWPGIASD
ncbi:MAG: hypothetical protein JSR82_14580 [Verrucomicrobia bacterium]|nr:hypothetical protein [Verrucomicrobiota bacterium]